MTEAESEAIVRALLAAAGLRLTEQQIAACIRVYPAMRAGADSLFIAEARYESPALVFCVAAS